MAPGELFDLEGSAKLDCGGWLGQQLVMFDQRGITLKDVIRTVATYEGAHSINVSRLMQEEKEKVRGPFRYPERHISQRIFWLVARQTAAGSERRRCGAAPLGKKSVRLNRWLGDGRRVSGWTQPQPGCTETIETERESAHGRTQYILLGQVLVCASPNLTRQYSE